MTTHIFHVLSNFKHDGDMYSKGRIFESESTSDFDVLIADKVLEIVPAKNITEAAKVIEARKMQVDSEVVSDVETQNTWEAKKDPVVETEKPAGATGELKKYKVLHGSGVSIGDTVYQKDEVFEAGTDSKEVIHFLQGHFIEEIIEQPVNTTEVPKLPEDAGANL